MSFMHRREASDPLFRVLPAAYNEQINNGNQSRTERRVHCESAPLINMEQIVWADPSGVWVNTDGR